MNILLLGSGGREHAIAMSLSKSPKLDKLYVAPGNYGISQIAEIVDIKIDDYKGLVNFAKENEINLTIVGPENPLDDGIVDIFEANGLRIFGPSKSAAIIESSKVFSKNLMKKYNIPTAKYEVFYDYEIAEKYILSLKSDDFPIVIKADGLAAGKGVVIPLSQEEAINDLKNMMIEKVFSTAADKIVIEEFLHGKEISLLCFSDGNTIKPMISAMDHKRVFDNDEGLNTGGMGAIAPNPIFTEEDKKYSYDNILKKTINAMNSEGRKFKGILFCGLMKTEKGIFVIEYNARFGDPETQAVLSLLESDLIEIIEACVDEKLESIDIKWMNKYAVSVILASAGYPEKYEVLKEITGLDSLDEKTIVQHSATIKEDNKILTNGGRVLAITRVEDSLDMAISKTYSEVKKIHFDGIHYRKDIGKIK